MIHEGKFFQELKNSISREVEIIKEMNSFFNNLESHDQEEKDMVFSQTSSLKKLLKKENDNILIALNKISLVKPLQNSQIHSKLPRSQIRTLLLKDQSKTSNENFLMPQTKKKKNFIEKISQKRSLYKKFSLKKFEKDTLKRIGKKEKEIVGKKTKKPSTYVSLANRLFSNVSSSLIEKGMFKNLNENLSRTNREFLLKGYVSIILFTTLLSVIAGIFTFTFFLFFNIQIAFPFITMTSDLFMTRFLKVFWILFAVPIATFSFAYFYPALEKDSLEKRINQELPFATINMAAISGSMINPTEIFSIIVSTKEYPILEKEFIKIINGMNVLGYDLITVLRNSAFHSPSKKLADLLNGIATTVNSGGDLGKFFDERAKNLLFEYDLEKEKSTRAAETFMDIYISVVIATPMILMLLLIMMQISGLGISLSTGMITLIMVLGVTAINIVFLSFLHIKQSNE